MNRREWGNCIKTSRKKLHCQNNSHQDSFSMSISNHRNDIACTVEFRWNRGNLGKCLINHHFPLHLPQQIKYHSGDSRYAASNCHSINLQSVVRVYLIGRRGIESTKLLGMLNLPSQGFKGVNYKSWSTCKGGRTAGERCGNLGGT